MPVEATQLKLMIDAELSRITDDRVLRHVRGLLVEPHVSMRGWDYGEPSQRYACWIVLENDDTGIGYCENGFGPRTPWGLLFLKDDGRDGILSMGIDSAWFGTFLEAFWDSFAATTLPIWRVSKTDDVGARIFLTGEESWESAWEQCKQLRTADPRSQYSVDHTTSQRV